MLESAGAELRRPRDRAELDLDDPTLYFSRELSWLAFNARVLDEAFDPQHPLLERLKFCAIFATNLDEFFMIRVAGLKQQIDAGVVRPSDDGILPADHLRLIRENLDPLVERQVGALQDELLPALASHGVALVSHDDLRPADRGGLRRYFDDQVFAVLTPLAVDPGHPFPYISNLSLSLAVEIEDPSGDHERTHFARVKVPQVLPRFIPLEPQPGAPHRFALLEDVIGDNLGDLFPGMRVRSWYRFRVTRNADLDLQEDEADDLLEMVESELRKRRFGAAVRLEVDTRMPERMLALLMDGIEVEEQDVYRVDGPLAVGDFMALASLDVPELRDKPFSPAVPARFHGLTDFFAAIRENDVLLHHPYDSFDPVVQFVQEAADDPQVLAIKQTLYRTSGDSPVVRALMEAVENGKQVAALVELKARFDEENNIHWARNLERAGVHVVYGLVGLKTHCKTTLVVRKEDDGLRRYVHIGTGNYNDKTARVYTDLSYFTCRADIGADVTDLFNYLTGFSRREQYRKLLVAPINLRASVIELIEREAEHARRGRVARIVAKMNAVTDHAVIRALYAASQAGVEIDLIVRGMCVLRPGIPGVSERIRVISIVGRFLEHSRAWCFANGGEVQVYLGSADWMGRNLDRRVEVMTPIEDAALRAWICGTFVNVFLEDDVMARELQRDGRYVRRRPEPGAEPRSSQARFLTDPSLRL
ncbi:MAG TPA: polyphosphate kinase 1 [Candidatus Dormibacteraeota bacterium]|nr:polyphosphate kinase 1 [Candidatus Dormibacteraeota bacterium]